MKPGENLEKTHRQRCRPLPVHVSKYYLTSRVFGINFGIKPMERNEQTTRENRGLLVGRVSEVDGILKDEHDHESLPEGENLMLTIIRTAAMLVVMLSILGCQTWQEQKKTTVEMKPAAARFDAGEYERISPEKGAVYWIDSDASEVRLFLWRGGPMASKGHNHVLVVRNLEGAVFVPNSMLEDDMRFDMVFQAADIEVDPPTHRKKIGGAFATEIPPEGIEGTRGNMLSERVLNAKKFPAVGLSAVQVYGEPPKMAVHTAVTLHGVERLYLVPATVEVNADRVSARGAFAIEQTDFGIKPMSVMGGALFVEDPIMIEFSLVGRPPSP